jgi:alpha-glucosidase
MAKKDKSKSWLFKQLKKLQKQLEQHEEEVVEEENKEVVVPITETTGMERYHDVSFDFQANRVERYIQQDSEVTFYCQNGLALKIILLSEKMLRFRYAKKGTFPKDFSYAIDPNFEAKETPYIFEEKKNKFLIQTQKLICEVDKDNLKITLKDLKGKVICEDEKGYFSRSTLLNGVTEVKVSKKSAKEEYYFGLGDKSCSLNLKGKKLQNWCSDAFGYGENTDPLYRSIPFYFSLNKGVGYGIFFDNTYRSYFDFDEAGKGVMSFAATGGEIDYYFIYGPALTSVAEQYTHITGRPELPPLWALGFHQCRWSYYPESRVKEVSQTFRDKKIPCDAIYLDIDYMDGYRCFTWNNDYFPKPSKMISDLQKEGFQTVVMIDPGIREDHDYHVYKEGFENDYFCKRTNGDLMLGPVWPPNCGFPDFTNPTVRDWWGALYDGLYQENGVSGFWNDMNEPALFKVHRGTFPDEVLHHYEGENVNHAKAHNIYGFQMSRATTEGLKKLKPAKRPFLLTRATYAGGQRFAALWTGDNMATWEHLQLGNRQCQRLSISGFSFVGTDVGGFFKYPDGELLVRWLQLGIFHPFYRIHSMGNNDDGSAETDTEKVKKRDLVNRLDQEPWAFGKDFTPFAKKAIELRYQLLPYIYTAFWQYVQKGTPMIRSLSFYDQLDENALNKEQEFLFGDHILTAPILEPKAKKAKVYLPKGDWYDYWHGDLYEGNQTLKCKVSLDKFPFFIKAGAVIPHYPIMQYTGEKKVEVLQLKVYAPTETGTTVNSALYEDAGEGYAYQKGKFSLRNFKCSYEKGKFQLRNKKEGGMKSDYRKIQLEIYGLSDQAKQCFIDGEAHAFEIEKNILSLKVSCSFKLL